MGTRLVNPFIRWADLELPTIYAYAMTSLLIATRLMRSMFVGS